MRLGDWYKRVSDKDNSLKAFVWDVDFGRIELRNYASVHTRRFELRNYASVHTRRFEPTKYILTPAQLAAEWQLHRKNDSGQIVNPRFLQASVGLTPDDKNNKETT